MSQNLKDQLVKSADVLSQKGFADEAEFCTQLANETLKCFAILSTINDASYAEMDAWFDASQPYVFLNPEAAEEQAKKATVQFIRTQNYDDFAHFVPSARERKSGLSDAQISKQIDEILETEYEFFDNYPSKMFPEDTSDEQIFKMIDLLEFQPYVVGKVKIKS